MQSLNFPNTKEGCDKILSAAAVMNSCLSVKFTYFITILQTGLLAVYTTMVVALITVSRRQLEPGVPVL